MQARTLRGTAPLGEVHEPPPDSPDSCTQSSIALELGVIVPKARRPVFDKGARAGPDPWPGPGATTIDLDTYPRASVLLEGEQNLTLPCVGSEQHAAPCTPHSFPFSPLLNTHTCGTAPSEGAASIRHTADPHLEVWKPPNPNEELRHEAGGVCLDSTGHLRVVKNTDAEAVKRAGTEAHEAGRTPLDANTAPISTEGAAGVELIGVAKKAATAEPEAVEPRAEGEVWCRLDMLLLLSRGASGAVGMQPRDAPTEGMHRHGLKAPLRPLREGAPGGERGPNQAPQETLQAGVLALQESASAVLKGTTPGFPEEDPPRGIEGEPGGKKIFDLKRPFEARTAMARATLATTKTNLVASKVHQYKLHLKYQSPTYLWAPITITHHRNRQPSSF